MNISAEMQDRRLICCQENLNLFERIWDRFLQNIVTMDETPLALYVPESRRESQEWKLPGEECTRKMRSSTSHKKALMLTTFWDANGMILVDFSEAGVRINNEYYSRLLQQARKLRRKSRVCELYYLHDNAPNVWQCTQCQQLRVVASNCSHTLHTAGSGAIRLLSLQPSQASSQGSTFPYKGRFEGHSLKFPYSTAAKILRKSLPGPFCALEKM